MGDMHDGDSSLRTVPVDGETSRRALGQAGVLEAWDRFRDEVYAFLLGVTRDPSTSEDLLQEAYLRLLREARAGSMPDQPRAWLYRVAANLATSRGRRLVVARRWFERVGVPSQRAAVVAPPPDRRIERREAFDELDEKLGHLAADARVALLLSADGFSGREIAAAIGRSEAATRTLMCRARLRLRHELDGSGAPR